MTTSAKNPSIKTIFWPLAAALTLALTACGKGAPGAPGGAGGPPGGMPPPEVSIITVQPKALPVELEYTGQTAGSRETEVRAQGFDDRFIRKWRYYLSYCEAAFALRNVSVVQAVYTRPNNHSLDQWHRS